MVSITANDVSQILELNREESEKLLEKMTEEKLLIPLASDGEKKYGKAG